MGSNRVLLLQLIGPSLERTLDLHTDIYIIHIYRYIYIYICMYIIHRAAIAPAICAAVRTKP